MHQPPYRDPLTGRFVVPSLLDQIEAYARGEATDGHQELSLKPAAELDEADRVAALRVLCLAHPNLITAIPRFAELVERRGARTDEASLREAASRFSVEDLRDLQVVAKLAWFDRGWQEDDPVVRDLLAKGRTFDEADKARLAERERAL